MGIFSYRKGLVSFKSQARAGGNIKNDEEKQAAQQQNAIVDSNNNYIEQSPVPAETVIVSDDDEAQRTLAGDTPFPPASTSTSSSIAAIPKHIQGQQVRLQQQQSSTARTEETDVEHFGYDYDLPRLRGFKLWHRKWSLWGYATFILFCNLAAPCILYYVLHDHSNLSEHALLGIATATLGISSSFDNPFRNWKLWKHRDLYGPLNDTGPKWHLDFTMHLYSFSLFPIFAIPLAVATSVPHPMYKFFNMSTPMLVATPGVFFLISLFKPKAPFWISSDPPGTPLKPGVFYLFEDIGAVDFRHGKPFREALHARYRASPIYRDMFWWLTIFWVYGCTFYFAIVAAVNWTLPFGYSFGLILGLLFLWLVSWGGMTIYIAKYFQKKEQEWLELKKSGDAQLARAMTLEGAHDLAIEEGRRRRASRRSSSRRRPTMEERRTSTSINRSDGIGEVHAPTTSALQRTASPDAMELSTDPVQPNARNAHDPLVPATGEAEAQPHMHIK